MSNQVQVTSTQSNYICNITYSVVNQKKTGLINNYHAGASDNDQCFFIAHV